MDALTAEDPQWIGDYRLLGRLGAGGMGRVYLARSGGGRTVAVKLIKAGMAEQSEFRHRFRQEVEAARRVGDAWTAPVLDADTEAEVPRVATGYIAGPSLQQVVGGPPEDGRGPLPEHSVRTLAFGLAQALRDIHGAGLIHRDLKPSNILITIDGPRVIDFGIARALESAAEDGVTLDGTVVGSPSFMSPEQVRSERVTAASDVFCLGTVLAYAATGRTPFGSVDSGIHAVMFKIAEEDPDLSGLPDGPLRALIASCLAKQPGLRPTPDEIAARTRPEESGTAAPPWLPAPLIAQLGRQAVRLLDTDTPPSGAPGHQSAYAARPAQPDVSAAAEFPQSSQSSEALEASEADTYTLPAGHHGPPLPEPGHGAAERPGQRARRALLAAAAVVVVAAVAGTAALPALRGRGDDGAGASASAVPQPYVGTWSGAVERDGEPTGGYRRFVISRGEIGELVATSISLGGTYQCKSDGKLVSTDDGVRLDTKVVKSRPEGRCAALGEHFLKLRSASTLTWSAAGRNGTLRKVVPGSERVPEGYLGTWEQQLSGGGGGGRQMIVRQAPVGSPVLSLVSDVNGRHCEASAELFSVGETLMVGPSVVTESEPAGGCEAGASSTLRRVDGGRGLHREFTGGDMEPRTYAKVR
ncbi:protein kinase [Streptomyces sp. NPDC004647]|uniref:serine/threonine-protein kinase n=1 Tax=Streptomyces sp. NPDC004647 TaxID=3154671 RepID=UPI0033B500FA